MLLNKFITSLYKSKILFFPDIAEIAIIFFNDQLIGNFVLKELGTDRKQMFPKKFYRSYPIKHNKSQIRNMIGKWNAANCMAISEVVNDIIDKVKNHKEGIYYYQNSGNKNLTFDEKAKVRYFFHVPYHNTTLQLYK